MSGQQQAGPQTGAAKTRNLAPQSVLAYRGNKFVTHEWQPHDVPVDASTADLAGVYEHFWRWIPAEFGDDATEMKSRPEISQDGLKRLLRLAFLASLETDEQRPTRGKLYVPASHEPQFSAALSFETPKPLDLPQSLARLCPTLITDDAALLLAESGSDLVVTGIAYLDDQHANYRLLEPPREWIGRRGGLLVSILAPGEIRMRQGYLCDYTLRGGTIFGRSPVVTAAPVKAWLDRMHANVLSRLLSTVVKYDPQVVPEDDSAILSTILSRILTTATRLRHGGTIVVLPSPELRLIEVKYPAALRAFTKTLDRFYHDRAVVLDKRDKADGTRAISRFETRRHSLLTIAEALGGLTATDGCVVLDNSMQLLGFGGIIDTECARSSPALEWGGSPSNLSIDEATILERFGTRHRSAYLLCRSLPNTMAFVVSQDGDLRLFASDDRKVFYFDSVSP
jgi:hypothetical protein